MLYGGLFMLIAVVLSLSFLGERVRRWSALLGGAGFGIFIDELGKFITKDNNYFYRPTIGLIYAIFIILFLAFNFLSRTERLSADEYELNALNQVGEAVSRNLSRTDKRRIAELLAKADGDSPITRELKQLLKRLETVPTPAPGRVQRWLKAVDKQYQHFWRLRRSHQLISVIFVAQAAVFVIVTLGTVFHNFGSLGSIFQVHDTYDHKLIIGQLASSAVAGLFAIAGAIELFRSRLQAFELFRKAVLINLLLTEFFVFSRLQFGAVPGFLVNLALLIALRYAIHEEQRAGT